MTGKLKAALVLFCLLWSAAAWSAPFRPGEPILPLKQVKIGMKGYGKSVFQGNRIQAFPVEVLGVVKKKERPSELILIRASGPDIDKAGGLASGMSGSPIYLDGKLAGAFSFGWDYGDPKMGLVTPIEHMTKLFDYKDQVPSFPPVADIGAKDARTPLDEQFDELYDRYVSGQSVEEPKNVLIADGISRRSMKKLERLLDSRVFSGGSDDNHVLPGPRQKPAPGASVSALLAWGDVALNVCGTLTAADNSGRFVAFGHSFKNWGAVSYPIAYNTIHGIVNSIESPFKLSSAANIIGMVTQDRPEGIAGYFGRYAPAVSVRVEVEDRDSGRKSLRRFQMVNDRQAVVQLLPELVSGLADMEIGRVSGGSVRYNVVIDGEGMPKNWGLGDVVAAKEDVLGEAMIPISALVEKVVNNPYQDLGTVGLDISLFVSSSNLKLLIEGLSVDKTHVSAGDEITATVTLRPWRQTPQVRRFKLRVPLDMSGACSVVVRAGASVPADDAEQVTDRRLSSFPQFLSELKSAERACEVVVELTSQSDGAATAKTEFAGETRRRRLRSGAMRVFRSDYVVDGNLQVPVFVGPGE